MHGIKRRLAGALVALSMIAGSLVIGGTAAQAVNVSAVHGPECPDVMVIAARGSGEDPQGGIAWSKPASYNSTNYYGVGEFNNDVYDKLGGSRRDLTISLDPVMYPADSVDFITQDPGHFRASVDTGASVLVGEVDRINQVCGGRVKYVFSGYSQGAWVVHDALWQLDKRTPKPLVGKVVGVTLFGDPLYVPGQAIVRDGPPSSNRMQGSAALIDKTNVPSSLQSVTASYCLAGDPVCQANLTALGYCELVGWASGGPCPHMRYKVQGETAKAAAFIAPHMPKVS